MHRMLLRPVRDSETGSSEVCALIQSSEPSFSNHPLHRHGQFLSEAVVVVELPLGNAVFVDELGDLHVVAAVFRNLHQFALLEPLNGLQQVR